MGNPPAVTAAAEMQRAAAGFARAARSPSTASVTLRGHALITGRLADTIRDLNAAVGTWTARLPETSDARDGTLQAVKMLGPASDGAATAAGILRPIGGTGNPAGTLPARAAAAAAAAGALAVCGYDQLGPDSHPLIGAALEAALDSLAAAAETETTLLNEVRTDHNAAVGSAALSMLDVATRLRSAASSMAAAAEDLADARK